MAEAVRNQQVLAIAHDENVVQWAEAIAQSLQDASEPVVLFPQLCLGLKMPWVEVWRESCSVVLSYSSRESFIKQTSG